MTDDANSNQNKINNRLIGVADWPKFHPWPPIGGLRHLIFNSKKNGFAKVLKRVGRRVLIDEQKFFEFVEEKSKETVK